MVEMRVIEGGAAATAAAAGGETCASCRAALDLTLLVCRYCGAPARPAASIEEQRRALVEYRQLFQQALAEVKPGDVAGANAARERFFRHAIIPDSTALILDEAVFCRQCFDDDSNVSKPARMRFEALMLKLSLVADGDARTLTAVATLKRELEEQRARERANDSKANRIFLLVIGGAALLLWLAARACVGAFSGG
jgi:hypothetical protein